MPRASPARETSTTPLDIIQSSLPKKATLKLVGLAEAAELAGVSRATLSQRLHCQREFKAGDELPPFPEPVCVLRATPVWHAADIRAYSREVERRARMGCIERYNADRRRRRG